MKIKQETRYPWEGSVRITVFPQPENDKFSLLIRIPGWAQNQPVPSDLYRFLDVTTDNVMLKVNREVIAPRMKNGYAHLERIWRQGDVIELELPLPVRRIVAHDSVAADRGRVALQRGPIVFCAEGVDNKEGHVRNLLLPDDAPLTAEFHGDMLNGIQIIKGRAYGYTIGADGKTIAKAEQDVVAIPYYAWAHRGKGEMAVWLAREESAVKPLGLPTLASTSSVSVSYGNNPAAIHDLLEPQSSGDHEVPFFHWWPHKGTQEWVQYDFGQPEEISTVEVYWFDDTGIGECRVPQSWRILYRWGNDWKPVYTTDVCGIEKDKYNKVVFETVKTAAIRLEIQSQPDFAGGIHEWRIR